jgi:CIC family chloride channel protein
VVATATRISCTTQTKCFKEYKTELICAGIAAGITALFNSPIADFFFVLEVISRKVTRALSLVISLQWQ